MDDDELAELTHTIAQETMKALENVFFGLCLEENDPRYFFAAEAVKHRREASEVVWRKQHGLLTGTPLFELDSDHEENQNQKQES